MTEKTRKDSNEKYIKMTEIAKKQSASMPTCVEMLVRCGCAYDKAIEIVVDAYRKGGDI